MVEAFVLIQATVGQARAVATAVGGIGGVISSVVVAGPYDVIARAEAEDVDSLGRLVVSEIQLVDGVTRTLTCPVAHLIGG